MLFHKIIRHHAEIRESDFMQIVVYPGVGLVNLDDTVQDNRRAD